MSILLSTYWTQGIVFSADKNATLKPLGELEGGRWVDVGAATKVVGWPRKRAVVGFVGLGQLAGLRLEEWMRQFVARTREFEDLEWLAGELCGLIQEDFDYDYPLDSDIADAGLDAGLIVHLGGFRDVEGTKVPAMYLITNLRHDDKGGYHHPVREFTVSDQIAGVVPQWGAEYPSGVRAKIAAIEDDGRSLWFNNGYMYPAFNELKGALWVALKRVREFAELAAEPTLQDRVAYSEMAVRLFGLFFDHHYRPEWRAVGGGADTEWVPWPE